MKNIRLFWLLGNGSSCVFGETLQESMQKTQEAFQKFLQYPLAIFISLCFCILVLWGSSLLLSFLFSRVFKKKNFVVAVWTGWDILFFILFYFFCFIVLANLMGYCLPSFAKDKEYLFRLLVYWAVHIFCFSSLVFFLAFLPGYDKKSLGLCAMGYKDALGVMLGYICFLPWYFFLFYFSHLLFSLFHLEPKVQEVAQELLKSQGFTWWFAVITVVLVAPVIEEFLFRVFIYESIREYLGVMGAIIITSIVFSIMHQNLFAFFPILGLGIFLQILYEKSQCLWVCVLAHSIHNTLTLLYLL